MDFIIEVIDERETKDGKKYKSVTLNGGSETYEKVSLWSDDPNYASYVEGGRISGDVYKNAKGYWNFKGLEQKKTYTTRTNAVTKAVKEKNENIVAAQDRKHDAIKMAGAQRDAVLMVTTFNAKDPFPTEAELKSAIEAWMRYFLGLQDVPFI